MLELLHAELDRLRRELTVAKMIANERARSENPHLTDSPIPGAVRILKNRRELPDDTSLSGLAGTRMVGVGSR